MLTSFLVIVNPENYPYTSFQRAILEKILFKYVDLYDFAPVGYSTLSAKGLILEANLTAATLLGVARGTLIKQPLGPFIFKEDQGIYYRHLKQLFETGESQMCEPRIVKKGGTTFWAHLTAVTAQDENGAPACRVVISDITERKRAEQALRESEEKFRVIASSTPDHLLVQDRELRYSFVINPPRDLTEKDMIGKTDYDFLSKEDADKLTKLKRQVIETGKPAHLETPLISIEGKEQVFDGSYVPKLNAEGQIDGMIGYFRNVTERKQAEEVLRRYELLSGQSRDIILFMRRDNGRILEANAAAMNAYGYTHDELLTLTIQDLRAPDTHGLTADQMAEANARGILFETVHRRKDGSTFPVEVSSRGATTGATRTLISVIRDITKRKEAEQALRQRGLELQHLNETLEQRVQERTAELTTSNEALRQLSMKLLSAQEDERKRIAGELHDTIGSCLNAAKFKIGETLLQTGKTPDAASESLNAIVPLIQEGIDECRRIQMDLRPPMLDDLGLLGTLSWFFRRFQTIYSGIQIDQEIGIEEADVPLSLKTVVFRVTQEAMNNIAKYSKADLVHLSLRKMDGRIQLVIQDNGQGFDLKRGLDSESTKRGLGLTSMRERTELSGGSFDLQSAIGKGTLIRVSWPT